MTQFMSFNFQQLPIRIITDNGNNPLWVAKDVAEALGYSWNGESRIQHVPEEWRGVTSVVTPSGMQEMWCLSEQGLYFFLGRSDKPNALPFQKWIAGKVLPSIRKTGQYSVTTNENHRVPKTFREALLLAADQQALIEQQQAKIESDKPRVEFSNYVESIETSEEPQLFRDMVLGYAFRDWKLEKENRELKQKLLNQEKGNE